MAAAAPTLATLTPAMLPARAWPGLTGQHCDTDIMSACSWLSSMAPWLTARVGAVLLDPFWLQILFSKPRNSAHECLCDFKQHNHHGNKRTSTSTQLVRIINTRASVKTRHFHDVEPCFGIGRETLTATGCFCLNKNHTLSGCASGNYSSRDSEKLLWLWLLAYFIFNLVRRLQRRQSKIYRMMSKISSPSRLPANRLLPQWLGEKHWKVAAVFAVMHGQTHCQTAFSQSLWFWRVGSVCVLRCSCAVYQDAWADLDCWNTRVMTVCWG